MGTCSRKCEKQAQLCVEGCGKTEWDTGIAVLAG